MFLRCRTDFIYSKNVNQMQHYRNQRNRKQMRYRCLDAARKLSTSDSFQLFGFVPSRKAKRITYESLHAHINTFSTIVWRQKNSPKEREFAKNLRQNDKMWTRSEGRCQPCDLPNTNKILRCFDTTVRPPTDSLVLSRAPAIQGCARKYVQITRIFSIAVSTHKLRQEIKSRCPHRVVHLVTLCFFSS